jgi:putative zinc finger protein
VTCRFAHDDGAYVLGALSPAERADFEDHLGGCPDCSRGVRELAGLPGLLARVSPELLDEPPADQPVPDTLLPRLVGEVRRGQRRRMLLVAGGAAAATLVVVGGWLAVAGVLGEDDEPSVAVAPPSATATLPVGLEMTPVNQDSTEGEVALTQVLWGTRLDLTCTYAEAEPDAGPEPRYAMFVRTRAGREEQVATWRGLPGKTMRLAAATAADRDDITSVEVRTLAGRTVLRVRS